jgi:hypothetical protein
MSSGGAPDFAITRVADGPFFLEQGFPGTMLKRANRLSRGGVEQVVGDRRRPNALAHREDDLPSASVEDINTGKYAAITQLRKSDAISSVVVEGEFPGNQPKPAGPHCKPVATNACSDAV